MALVQESAPQGQAAPPVGQAAANNFRYDPVILRTGLMSTDWRVGTTTNAIGIAEPAVNQQGRIRFFEPFPGQRFCSFKQGGRAPFECTLFQMRLAIRSQHERSVAAIGPAYEVIAPRGVQLAEIIGRGLLTLKVNKITVVEDLPVDDIGAAGGIIVNGAPMEGTGNNRGSHWQDGFPLPEPIQASSSGPDFEGWIDLLQDDFVTLGQGIAALGVGAPLENARYIDAAGALQVVAPLPSGVFLEFFGQRGLNVKSGQFPQSPGGPCYGQ